MESTGLGKELESYVQQLVATGRYNSTSEVLQEGVRLIQERERHSKVRSISTGGSDVAVESRMKSVDEVFQRLATKPVD